MSAIPETIDDKTMLEWQEFIKFGVCAETEVRQQILNSWRRCFKSGLNPYNNSKHAKLDDEQMQNTLIENKDLLDIAQPFMENLYKIVEGSGFVVVLTDANGYILELFADNDTLINSITINFFKGACWSEEEAGTNAIGTAMVIQQPIQVNGSEHYCYKHHCLTCSAAPIFDVRGNLIGILDISGTSTASHPHTLGMAVAGAKAIMAQIATLEKNRELNDINQQLTNVFDNMSDAVLVINTAGQITRLNPIAGKILCQPEQDILGCMPDELFGWKHHLTKNMLKSKEPYNDIEFVTSKDKELGKCLISGEPITDENGTIKGGIIFLRPIDKIQKLASKLEQKRNIWQFRDIVGNSSGILEASRVATLAANTSTNVLLYGESGTGKEIFAQAIHSRSDRKTGPFVAVNCGAIPKELITSELFGYDEGSFTGAKKGGKQGKFEIATGGTLFLDEIGDMPLEQQVALLRVLQERKIVRIGSDKEIPIDVRIICATNKSLTEMITQGKFRKDLYYRLNVISIIIPPLRDRGKDILLLFHYFLEKTNISSAQNFVLDLQASERLMEYNWPGNVRELQNVVERIVSLTQGPVISLSHLPHEIRFFNSAETIEKERVPSPLPGNVLPLNQNLGRQHFRQMRAETEKQEILVWLKSYSGNVSMTAKKMGISRNTLYRKMKIYGIDG